MFDFVCGLIIACSQRPRSWLAIAYSSSESSAYSASDASAGGGGFAFGFMFVAGVTVAFWESDLCRLEKCGCVSSGSFCSGVGDSAASACGRFFESTNGAVARGVGRGATTEETAGTEGSKADSTKDFG